MEVRSREFEALDAQQSVADELDRFRSRVEKEFVGGNHGVLVVERPDQPDLDLQETLLAVTPAERLFRPALEDEAALFIEACELDLGRDHLLRLDRYLVGCPEPFPRPPLESLLKTHDQEKREAGEREHGDGRADPLREDRATSTERPGTGAGPRRNANHPAADRRPVASLAPPALSTGAGRS